METTNTISVGEILTAKHIFRRKDNTQNLKKLLIKMVQHVFKKQMK